MRKEQMPMLLESDFIEEIRSRCAKENLDVNSFIELSVEKRYLHPFLSRRHLRNYYYLNNVISSNKEYNKNRQILFYILAFDGIYMHYIKDIYKIKNNQETAVIPKELNDILHPGFCLIDAACEIFKTGEIYDLRNAFKWLKYDDGEAAVITNSIMMSKGILSIKDELYNPRLFNIDIADDLNRVYTPEEYAGSRLFNFYSTKMQKLLIKLFDTIAENNMYVDVRPSTRDELTFSLVTKNGKRLAIISSSDDGTNLRIGINRWKNSMHGNMLYCYDLGDIGPVVKDDKIPDTDLLTKYKEIVN